MKQDFIYVANWKAYFSFAQTRQWIIQNKQNLVALAKHHNIAICPSYDALYAVGQELKNSNIKLGAQDCSAHAAGAYTGQILAQSLQEMGCTYCIVGHPEVRAACPQSPELIAQKAVRALQHGMIPIICIGETAVDYDTNRGLIAIEEQMVPILTALATYKGSLKTIAIGYEPQWIIGKQTIIPSAYLDQQLEKIHHISVTLLAHYKIFIFYGGGINETSIATFKTRKHLDGVLIGSASTNFQIFEKIVLS